MNVEQQDQNNEKPIDNNEDNVPQKLIPPWKIKKEGRRRR